MNLIWTWNQNRAIGTIVVLFGCVYTVAAVPVARAGAPATIELVSLPSPSAGDTSPTLPASQEAFDLGTTFFVEVWVQTGNTNGLSSVSVDVDFDASLVSGAGITYTALFQELHNGVIDNGVGVVDDLSASHLGPCSDQVGVAPNWARAAIVEMTADAEGALSITAGSTGAAAFGTAICSVGDVNPATITYGTANVTVSGVPVPTLTAWGAIALCLVILTAGSVVFSRASERDTTNPDCIGHR